MDGPVWIAWGRAWHRRQAAFLDLAMRQRCFKGLSSPPPRASLPLSPIFQGLPRLLHDHRTLKSYRVDQASETMPCPVVNFPSLTSHNRAATRVM
jgi:hypothetical protein